ncbi:MAG: hypothetical protein ACK4XG_03905 [Chromatiaceae bacterium]
MVWWVLAFVCLIVLMVVMLVRTDSLASEHKRLLAQFRMLDQESSQVQQFTYELAEEFSQFLLLQLGSVRRMSRLAEEELYIFELAIQLIPTLCKEMSSRQLALKPALQRALKLHADLEFPAVEAVISKHGRLINGWQKQNFAGYLQMCQQMFLLAKEFSHKDIQKPTHAGVSN